MPALQAVSVNRSLSQGYTDNLPILAPLSDRFPTSWNLSAARAISVVRYLEPQGIDSSQFSAMAFPVLSNDTPRARFRIAGSTS